MKENVFAHFICPLLNSSEYDLTYFQLSWVQSIFSESKQTRDAVCFITDYSFGETHFQVSTEAPTLTESEETIVS